MEKDKLLYDKTFESIKVYNANVAYWCKIVKKYKCAEEYVLERNGCFRTRIASKIGYDDNEDVICTFVNFKSKKCIRIIQYPPNVYDKKYEFQHFLTAWISQFSHKKQEFSELVISILLTRSNRFKAEKLIEYWLCDNKESLQKEIQDIYNGQYINM